MTENPLASFNELPRGVVSQISQRFDLPYATVRTRLLMGDEETWVRAREIVAELAAKIERLDQTFGSPTETPSEDAPDVR